MKKNIFTYHNLNGFFLKFVLNLIFQLSDLLIYANRTTTPTLHFRVHGQMMLKDVTVLDSEPRLGQEHCFNLYDGKKAVLIAASSHAEKLCWMEDIAEAAQVSVDTSLSLSTYSTDYLALYLHFSKINSALLGWVKISDAHIWVQIYPKNLNFWVLCTYVHHEVT